MEIEEFFSYIAGQGAWEYAQLKKQYNKIRRYDMTAITKIPDEFKMLYDKQWTNSNVEKIVLENTQDNHYKYYHLSQNKRDLENSGPIRNDGTYLNGGYIFTASWGRIGAKAQKKVYEKKVYNDPTMWEQMTKKLEKGYVVKLYQSFGEHSSAYDEFMALIGGDNDLFD